MDSAQQEHKLQYKIKLLKLLKTFMQITNETSSFELAIQQGLNHICTFTGWKVAHCYFIENGYIKNTELWYTLDDVNLYQDFIETTSQICLPTNGSWIGNIVTSKEPELVFHIDQNDQFLRKDSAKQCNLKSGFAFPVIEQGEVIAILEFFSDITEETVDEQFLGVMEQIGIQLGYVSERENYQKKLIEEKVKAEESNKAKSEFLANMSHELRTPMNAVLGMSEILIDTGLDTQQLNFARNIQRGANNLLVLLNDILDFSKIEAGALVLESHTFSPNTLVQDLYHIFLPKTKEAGVDLVINYDQSIPNCIKGDSGRLRQILVNLMGNAIKFTQEGSITLNIKCQSVCEKTNKAILHFSVTDTGIGIKEKHQKLIFDKFTQADASITRKFGGTGLGLAISAQLLSLMGSEMRLKSTEGVGSSFSFEIESEIGQDNSLIDGDIELWGTANTTIEQLVSAKDANVLVAEDDLMNQEVSLHLLQKLGFKNIDMVMNGKEAIEAAKNKEYTLILMDCQMPELDGFEATKHIRKSLMQDRIPIIATTANAMIGDKERCLKSGMTDYVSKPMKGVRLCEVLEKFVDVQSVDEMAITQSDEVVNMDNLNFITSGDKTKILELFELFFNTADECIIKLEDNCSDFGENEEWRKASHKLKGAAGSLGAQSLFNVCLNAEQGFDETTEKKETFLKDILQYRDEIKTFYKSKLVS